jgi:DNA modification methylase
MIEPYYETELGKLYHGDCLEIMWDMEDESIDFILTDPPYMNMNGGAKRYQGGVAKEKIRFDTTSIGDPWDANIDWISEAWRITNKGLMIFCTHHCIADFRNALKERKPLTLLVWYKRNAGWILTNAPKYDCEFIWVFSKNGGLDWKKLKSSLFDIPFLTAGCISTKERITKENGKVAHPTQKPIKLISELLEVGGKKIFDPFLGSGTTAVACERLNRRWIGIEINKEYCDIAVERIKRERAQEKMDFDNGNNKDYSIRKGTKQTRHIDTEA